MGKYMRKAKTSGEVAAIPSPLGVRTRAKTLALQRLEKSPKAVENSSSSSYLQLRSRLLVKHSVAPAKKSCRSTEIIYENKVEDRKEKGTELSACATENVFEVSMEASIGENVPDYESSRKSRETTPCSLIRDPETIRTPGSTTRQTTTAANTRRMRPSATRRIPTTQEIDELFAGPEQAEQKKFAQKYNFDPVNEQPLPGRYEWEKLDV